MNPHEKILVTGGSGMVGRNLQAHLPNAKYTSSKEFDLTRQNDVQLLMGFFKFHRVVHGAAMVGGLEHNMNYQYEYFWKNNLMNTFMLEQCRAMEVKHLTAILSTCIYPSVAKSYPMTEEMMQEGAPSWSNYGYAIAKRAMASGIECLNRQYGMKYNYIIPCNLYGKFDKTGGNSHYVAALIKKIHIALTEQKECIELIGDGTPLRQFMLAEDLAKVIALMVEQDVTENFNVATEELYSIDEIARIALRACGAEHLKIKYMNDGMNGQFRKDCDTAKFKSLFPGFKFTRLEDGIRETYQHYKQQLEK